MTELAGFARPVSLRAVVRGLADRRHTIRTHDTAASRSGPVGRQLGRLGSSWRVVDGVEAGPRGHIEHLVIGPGGVFVFSGAYDARRTVCLGGDSLLVDGARVHHVRESREDVADVSDRLSSVVGLPVPVTALVVVFGDRRFALPTQPDDATVRVVTPTGAIRWMKKRSTAWNHAGVERIHAAALASATWLRLDVEAAAGRRDDR
jgi:hypothetical protein